MRHLIEVVLSSGRILSTLMEKRACTIAYVVLLREQTKNALRWQYVHLQNALKCHYSLVEC